MRIPRPAWILDRRRGWTGTASWCRAAVPRCRTETGDSTWSDCRSGSDRTRGCCREGPAAVNVSHPTSESLDSHSKTLRSTLLQCASQPYLNYCSCKIPIIHNFGGNIPVIFVANFCGKTKNSNLFTHKKTVPYTFKFHFTAYNQSFIAAVKWTTGKQYNAIWTARLKSTRSCPDKK